MGWQEELRELDAKLAAGSVSADDYRLARDEILRKAHSGGTGSAGPAAAAEPAGQRPAPAVPAEQFAPPPQWDRQAPPAGENTQMMRQDPAAAPVQPAEADPTQVVSNPESGESTQIVPRPAGGPPPAPWMVARPEQNPPGAPPGGPVPWSPPPNPHWAVQDFDLVQPNAGWMAQGPEAFDKVSTKRNNKVLGLTVAAVLVVGLVAAGVLYFINRDTSQGATPQTTPTGQNLPPRGKTSASLPEPPAAKGAPSTNEEALVDPPGTVRGGGGAFDFADLQGRKLLPPAIISTLETAGMKDGLLKTTTIEPVTMGLFALTVKSEDDARAVALAYAKAQRDGGLPANDKLSMQGVPVFSSAPTAKDHIFRGVYVLYDRAVIIEAFGPDREAVQRQFGELLDQQIKLAPPSLRQL